MSPERRKKSEKTKTPSAAAKRILAELFRGSRITIWRDPDGKPGFYNYGFFDPALNKQVVESLFRRGWLKLEKSESGGPDCYILTQTGMDVALKFCDLAKD